MSRPPIQNPRGVPVVGDDAHLPPVDLERLSESALRERFRKLPEWAPEFRGDGALFVDHGPVSGARPPEATDSPLGGQRAKRAWGPVHAAVLVGLVPRDGSLCVLFTQRTAHLRKHAGQVSFPGGRSEAEDGTPAITALREAHEEIGLEPHRVDVLGVMPTYTTVTNFVVTPVVGIVTQPPAAYRPDPREVDAVFEVPLPFLMTPAHHRRHRFEWDGNSREFLSITWREPVPPRSLPPERAGPPWERLRRGPLDGAEHFIWGATAAMVRNLYRLLAA